MPGVRLTRKKTAFLIPAGTAIAEGGPEYQQALEGLANRLKVRIAPGPQCEMGSQSPRIARYVRESLK